MMFNYKFTTLLPLRSICYKIIFIQMTPIRQYNFHFCKITYLIDLLIRDRTPEHYPFE